MWWFLCAANIFASRGVLREWLNPGIAEIIQISLQGTHGYPVSRKNVRGEIEVLYDHLTGNPASAAQMIDHICRHVQIEPTFVGAKLDVHNTVAITGCRSLNFVSPVLHGVHDSSEEPE